MSGEILLYVDNKMTLDDIDRTFIVLKDFDYIAVIREADIHDEDEHLIAEYLIEHGYVKEIDKKVTRFGLIVAATPKGNIGVQNTIPWRLQGDLPRFKEMTLGQTVIYGRNTLESLPKGLPFKDRYNIILSSTLEASSLPVGYAVQVARNMDEAIHYAKLANNEWSYFVGGAGIYDAALDMVDVAHVTLVHGREDTEYDTRITNFNFPKELWDVQLHETLLEWPDYNFFPVPSHSYLTYRRKETASE